MSNLFERATRLQIRFNTSIGNLTVEDLWRLPLKDNTAEKVNLNDIAKMINREIKNRDEEDFVDGPNQETEILQLSLKIIKHVIKIRLEEAEAKDNKILRQQRNEKIAAIIEQKQDAELGEKSVEELQELIKDESS